MSLTGLRRRYAFLYALRWFGVGFIVPVLVLLPASRGLSVADIGIAFLPFGIVAGLLELPTGGLADTIGRRPVLVAAAVLQAASLVAWGLSRSTLAFACSAALMGVARALDSGPLEAWFVDATHDAGGVDDDSVRRGLAFGSVAECLALGTGSLIGGALPRLLDALPAGRSAVVTPLAIPFLLAALLSLVHALAVAALLVEAPRARGAGGAPSLTGAVREGLRVATRVRAARRLLVGFGVFGVVLTAAEVLWPPRVVDVLDLDEAAASLWLGALFAGAFVASAVGALLSPRLVTWLGGRPLRVLRAGQLACAASLVLMAATRSPALSIVAFLAVYLTLGTYGPLQRELLHDCVGREARSVLLSASSLVTQGGSVLTKVSLFPLAAQAGIPAAWLVAAAALALSAGLYVELAGRAERPAPSAPGLVRAATIAGSDPLP